MRTLRREHRLDDTNGADALTRTRTDIVLERADGQDEAGRYRFGMERGPFYSYERTLSIEPNADGTATATEITTYAIAVRFWQWVLSAPVKRRLGSSENRDVRPWWAPADPLDTQATEVLSILAILGVFSGYLGTLIGQTMTFAAKEFDAGDGAQGTAFAAIRIGAFIAFAAVTFSDRRGRRLALVGSAFIGVAFTALGAGAPSLTVLTLTQIVGRAFATAMFVLLPVTAAEEMPKGSRAYSTGVIGICSAFGAGIAIAALPLADLNERGWRLLFLIPLLGLPLLVAVARHLPESRRFEAHKHDVVRSGEVFVHRQRLILLGAVAFLINVLVAPASQFRNEFLTDVHGFNGTSISIFVLLTSAPAGIGAVIGGQLADRRGRRTLAGWGTIVGTFFTAVFFLGSGAWLWVLALSGTVVGSVAGPAVKVYEPEMFPTRVRSLANGIISAVSLVGSVLGLLVTGFLSDGIGDLGPAIVVTAIGPLIAGGLILWRYPETMRLELEELNPSDATTGPPPRPRDATTPGPYDPGAIESINSDERDQE